MCIMIISIFNYGSANMLKRPATLRQNKMPLKHKGILGLTAPAPVPSQFWK